MFGDVEVDTNALKSVRTGKADNGNQRVHNWSVIAVELEVSIIVWSLNSLEDRHESGPQIQN
jgi:hypothetical protein